MHTLRKIYQSQLFKISSLNSLSILLKIGVGLITSKLLAIFVGPSGVALVGNLRNFMTSLESIGTLGFQSGIVKYTAENKDSKVELEKIISTVLISLIFIALILSCGLYLNASVLNQTLFGVNYQYQSVIKALALALPWYIVSLVLIAVLNGLGSFKKVICINSIGSVIGLVSSLILITQYKTLGALMAVVFTPAMLFFISIYYVNKRFTVFKTIKSGCFDYSVIRKLSHYSLMALVSSFLGPLVFLMIRNNIITNLGINQAGYWETITRISSYYMLFVTTILTVYFLPKLVVSKNDQETKMIFRSYYQGIMPVFVVGVTVIYFCRFFIVKLLFTSEFLPVTSLFFWQLVGDVFKVASLILGYQFFAKRLTLAFILFELVSLALLYVLSLYLISSHGIRGVLMAQAIDNFIYFIVLVIYFRKKLI